MSNKKIIEKLVPQDIIDAMYDALSEVERDIAKMTCNCFPKHSVMKETIKRRNSDLIKTRKELSNVNADIYLRNDLTFKIKRIEIIIMLLERAHHKFINKYESYAIE